jgi:hypothetical protein
MHEAEAGKQLIGSMTEAREIYEACWNRWDNFYSPYNCPKGWEFIGQGSTRTVYRAPSGFLYKLCDSYEDDWPSVNDVENWNWSRLELPDGYWFPQHQLYVFNSWVARFNYTKKDSETFWGRVAIMAVEYVEGVTPPRYDRERVEAEVEAIGLFDTARGNIIKTSTGFCIVDAGEGYLDTLEYA